MKLTVMYIAVLIAALCFVLVYVLFFSAEAFPRGCGMDCCSALVPGYRWATGAIR